MVSGKREQPEHATTYPFVTIDLVGIEPAYDLWHSEYRLFADSEVEEESNSGEVSGHRLYDPSTSKQTDYGDPSMSVATMALVTPPD